QYSCRISVQPQSDSILCLLSTLPLSIHLSACLQTQSTPAALLPLPQSPPSFQFSLQLPYVPAFHCPVTKIKLSSQQPVAEITVFGTMDMLSTLRTLCYLIWSGQIKTPPSSLFQSIQPHVSWIRYRLLQALPCTQTSLHKNTLCC
ncbi:hypothetical protein M9458_032439, partial [Cirrhinus mrigala]